MNIYIISREQCYYDEYDSAIVCAENAEIARNMDPSDDGKAMTEKRWNERGSDWCRLPEQVKVEYVGKARKGMSRCVLLGSYNAG